MSKYYIDTGMLSGMYTLRVTYQETVAQFNGPDYTETRDNYVCNLATDWDRAVAKAQVMMEHPSHADDTLVTDSFELAHLVRPEYTGPAPRTAEEKEEADEIWRTGKYEMIKLGKWPFGKYYDENFDRADSGYIIYMANLEAEEGKEGAVMRTLQAALHAKFVELLAPTPEPNDKHFGTLGTRYHFDATVVESFSFDGFYGRQYIVKMVKDTGELIVYIGGSSNLSYDANVKVSFDAGVKKHDEYNDQNQTTIQRPTKIKALNQEVK